jgi:phosphohistidine phosphatase
MRLYLVQHGLAQPREDNPDRPLTQQGRNETRKTAELLVQTHAVKAKRVYHSGKLRAAETVEILDECLNLGGNVEPLEGLGPNDDPRPMAERLLARDESTLLVGHLPHLARLAALLLTGDSEKAVVHFTNSGVVCLEGAGSDWKLLWAMVPSLAP